MVRDDVPEMIRCPYCGYLRGGSAESLAAHMIRCDEQTQAARA